MPRSRVAVGRDQQLVRGVVAPPAQHHAGAEHPQHLQADGEAVIWVLVRFAKLGRETT